MKIIFMGTPSFAAPVLQALCAAHEVIAVYTQPPRPAGKGYRLKPSPVQAEAEKRGIPVRCPVSLKNAAEQEQFRLLGADAAVVCAYGLILPEAILQAPPQGCLNVHASLLPRWRGAAPIQRAIQAGDAQTGITIMQMDAGLDTGPILLQEAADIVPDMTAGELHDVLAPMGARLMLRALAEQPTPREQPDAGVTYAPKIQKEEAVIDWSRPALQVERDIRAFNPYPAAFFFHQGERIKVYQAEVDEPTGAPAGEVLDADTLRVACGSGTSVRLYVLQRAGKRVLPVQEFCKGCHIPKGTNLAL